MPVILDAAQMGCRKEAHAYLADALNFPDYYGNNLDALYDILTEYDDLEIQFINTQQAEPYFQKILRVFTDAAKHNENIHFTIE